MKLPVIYCFALLMLVMPTMTNAQVTTITYGDLVEGEITDEVFEVKYQFEGGRDDVIVIEMRAVDSLGDLSDPEIQLTNSDSTVIADTFENFDFAAAILTVQLPADDLYSIIATREDGEAGDSVGAFTLELIEPETLIHKESINASLIFDQRPQYFTFTDPNPLIFTYTHLDGQLLPGITINTLSTENPGSLEELSIAEGDALTYASLGVFESERPYIIIVEQQLFTFSLDEITADFELAVEVAE